MAIITHIELKMVDLKPKTRRVDAIQSFVSQETPIITIYDADGASGMGYSYTIGTGGSAIIALLQDTLLPAIIGKDAERIELIWRDLLFLTHATAVGAITSLALAAIDTALWDLKCKKANLPLWKALGGSREKIPLYTTEGGWLHLEKQQIIDDAVKMQAQGFKGAKVKIGSEYMSDDKARLSGIREKVGEKFEIMTDANQSFTLSEAMRVAKILEEVNIAWFEEPMPADDVMAHQKLARSTSVPIAVGESMYSLSQFKDYLVVGGASIVQVDVSRIGGITPWLKVAHLAEAHQIYLCPHFLMELHISLVCAIPNAKWLEYIPQLDLITGEKMRIEDGFAFPSNQAGLGIDWDTQEIAKMTLVDKTIKEAN